MTARTRPHGPDICAVAEGTSSSLRLDRSNLGKMSSTSPLAIEKKCVYRATARHQRITNSSRACTVCSFDVISTNSRATRAAPVHLEAIRRFIELASCKVSRGSKVEPALSTRNIATCFALTRICYAIRPVDVFSGSAATLSSQSINQHLALEC